MGEANTSLSGAKERYAQSFHVSFLGVPKGELLKKKKKAHFSLLFKFLLLRNP
jgi:hypothetical protein